MNRAWSLAVCAVLAGCHVVLPFHAARDAKDVGVSAVDAGVRDHAATEIGVPDLGLPDAMARDRGPRDATCTGNLPWGDAMTGATRTYCHGLYSKVSDYELCGGAIPVCAFNVRLNERKSCNDICGRSGATCRRAVGNLMDTPCIPSGCGDSCGDSNLQTEICVCEVKADGGTP